MMFDAGGPLILLYFLPILIILFIVAFPVVALITATVKLIKRAHDKKIAAQEKEWREQEQELNKSLDDK